MFGLSIYVDKSITRIQHREYQDAHWYHASFNWFVFNTYIHNSFFFWDNHLDHTSRDNLTPAIEQKVKLSISSLIYNPPPAAPTIFRPPELELLGPSVVVE